MNTEFQNKETLHLGYNVQRIREIEGLKQFELGQNCPKKLSQQRISALEQSEFIDEPTLFNLAEGLGVTIEFIKNFKEERAIYNIQTNRDNSQHNHNSHHLAITYDAADKIATLLEKFIEEDKAKTESIATLSKAVLDLAEEVKRLKSGE